MNSNIKLTGFTAVSALGYGNDAQLNAIKSLKTGLRPCDFEHCDLDTYIGRIPNIETYGVDALANMHALSRNNQIAYAMFQQDDFSEHVQASIERYGENRIAVILGTSTSGFNEVEAVYREKQKNTQMAADFFYNNIADFYATAQFIKNYFQLSGPAYTISTACSSSAKVFISAVRLLQLKLADAVIVAGVDSLCLNTLYGFNSLGLLAKGVCQPCDVQRTGLNIGEAGAAILLERDAITSDIALLGYGESTDGYHMSAPHPEGLGGRLAMQQALDKAKCSANDIDYINMHGTASQQNDAVEDKVISSIFGDEIPCSSTKGWTGHTLAAAGALEVIISCLALEAGIIPGCLNIKNIDPDFNSYILKENKVNQSVNKILTNSLGFGGNNTSLIIGYA